LPSLDVGTAKNKALSLGFKGGVFVIHPWRIKDEYQAAAEEYADRTGKNRYDYVRSLPDLMEALVYSPHCHVLGYGKLEEIKPGSKAYKYRNIRAARSLEALEGVMFYLLSHAAIPEKKGGNAYNYFGECSKHRLKATYTGEDPRPVFCPVCGAAMVDTATGEPVWEHHYVAEGWYIVKPVIPPPRVLKVSPAMCKALDLPPGLAT
jgi:hypothetical protein